MLAEGMRTPCRSDYLPTSLTMDRGASASAADVGACATFLESEQSSFEAYMIGMLASGEREFREIIEKLQFEGSPPE